MRRWAPVVALTALSFLTRLPALLNAPGTNSDAAIVALQARHIMHREWSPFLWGSGYQTSADSTWVALVFAVCGKTPIALMLSALSLYVALTLIAYCTLRRRLAPWSAFVATLPLVFTTACVHSYALYPPRQLALTVAFAAICAIDAGTVAGLSLGGFCAVFAWVCDPYAAIFVPACLALAIATVLRARDELLPRARALGAFFAGAACGAVLLALLFSHPRAQEGVASMSFDVIGHNAKLFFSECLPWTIGTKIFRPLHVMDYAEWKMPRAYAVVTWIGAASLALSMIAAGAYALRSASRPLRALAAIAWMTIAANVASFFVSRMVMDQFSMRYLAASVLMLPFALAPLVDRFGARVASLALAPYLFVAFVGGWLAHGRWVRGVLPARVDDGVVESRVLRALEERHVEAAIADYWASYRLAFLWREAIPIVPYHAAQDRYPPWRDAYAKSTRVAYVYDRDRSFEDPKIAEREIVQNATIVDRFTSERFDVVVIDRASGSATAR